LKRRMGHVGVRASEKLDQLKRIEGPRQYAANVEPKLRRLQTPLKTTVVHHSSTVLVYLVLFDGSKLNLQ